MPAKQPLCECRRFSRWGGECDPQCDGRGAGAQPGSGQWLHCTRLLLLLLSPPFMLLWVLWLSVSFRSLPFEPSCWVSIAGMLSGHEAKASFAMFALLVHLRLPATVALAGL